MKGVLFVFVLFPFISFSQSIDKDGDKVVSRTDLGHGFTQYSSQSKNGTCLITTNNFMSGFKLIGSLTEYKNCSFPEEAQKVIKSEGVGQADSKWEDETLIAETSTKVVKINYKKKTIIVGYYCSEYDRYAKIFGH